MASQEVGQSPGPGPGFFYGYIVVGAALCIMAAIWSTYYAFGVFFKPLLTEFGWTRAITSGAFSLAMIMHGLLGIVAGALTDRLGPRVVMTLSGFILGLGYLLMSQVSTLWQLYLFYGIIIGTGMGASFIPLVSMVARWFTKRRSMMTGIVASGTGIGALIGPPVATHLISAYDWRWSYIIQGSMILVVVVLAAQLLKRDPTQVGQVAYGENEGEEPAVKLVTKAFSLKEAVYAKQFWLASGMFFCYGFCVFAVMVHIVPHATDLGISATSAANFLITIGGLSIVGKVVLGRAADRIGDRPALIITFILMAVAFFWVVPATEAWMLYVFAAVFGVAYGGCAASQSPLVAWLFGMSSHGLIFGVTGVGVTIGAALGPFLAGYMFDVTGSYQGAFWVCAAIGIVGFILGAVLTPTKTS